MTRTITPARLGMLAALTAVALAPLPALALDKVKIVIPRNSTFVLNYYGARDAGVFKKHGIDLQIDARPFKGFIAGLPSKEAMVTTYAGTAAIAKINSGLDLVIIGGGLTVMQEVFVLTKSPIKSITDLRGKRFGSWSTGAGAFKALRAAVLDGFGFDVQKDTKFVQAPAPALVKLVERGNVDSMFNISSLTIAAMGHPKTFRSVFSPNDYWKKKTGQPIVWSAPIVAWRSWVDENRDRARRFVAATHESFRWLRKPANLHKAVKKYGTLAAVTNKADEDAYRELLARKGVFLAHWNQKTVDAQWRFLEMAAKHHVLGKVPPKAKYAMVLEKKKM